MKESHVTAVRRALGLAIAALALTVAVPAALADPPLPSADTLILTGDLTDESFIASSVAAIHQRGRFDAGLLDLSGTG